VSAPAPFESRALRSVTIAGARVEPELNRVTLGEKVERLEPKIMGVLLALAARPGEVVSKDELLKTVWNGTFVTEHVLTRAIGELRKLFADANQWANAVKGGMVDGVNDTAKVFTNVYKKSAKEAEEMSKSVSGAAKDAGKAISDTAKDAGKGLKSFGKKLGL